MKYVYRLLELIEHPPLDNLSPDAQAVLGSFIYLVGGGLFFLVAGLIVSVGPFWLLDIAGLL